MKAYKGFTKDLYSRHGDGIKENCSFRIGETKEVKESKTASNGFHCCENPFDCTDYYELDGKNRFFLVEAEGDIDEDEFGRIACTRITLVKELTYLEVALEGMRYMISHPKRKNWESGKHNLKVEKEQAETSKESAIAIARGRNPKVRGVEGSILGILLEDQIGEIIAAKLFVPTGQQSLKWFTIDESRSLQEVCA